MLPKGKLTYRCGKSTICRLFSSGLPMGFPYLCERLPKVYWNIAAPIIEHASAASQSHERRPWDDTSTTRGLWTTSHNEMTRTRVRFGNLTPQRIVLNRNWTNTTSANLWLTDYLACSIWWGQPTKGTIWHKNNTLPEIPINWPSLTLDMPWYAILSVKHSEIQLMWNTFHLTDILSDI